MLAVGLAGWLLVRAVLAGIPGLLRRSRTTADDLLFAALRPHLPIWFLALGVVIGARRTPMPHEWFLTIDRAATAIFVLSVSIATASFLTRLLVQRAAPGLERVPVNTLVQNVVRVGVIGLGVLVVLGNLGVSITPILTALGVGSLAVALALQPTLTNLFAGFHITLARHVRVGDYIELEAGQKGYVLDIGWRSTLVRELPDNTFVVPNARLAEMIVKNYSLPGEEHGTPVALAVAPGSDLEKVERVAREVAREVQRSAPGAVATHEPGVAFTGFGDSGIQVGVFLRVRDVPSRGPITHELIKRLHRRFREEGIEIALPRRVVDLTAAGAEHESTAGANRQSAAGSGRTPAGGTEGGPGPETRP
jgi:small-conductance mechanosensitive channel